MQGSTFAVREAGQQAARLGIAGDYHLDMPGDFNQGNAVAAMIATRLVGADTDAMHEGLEVVKTVQFTLTMHITMPQSRLYLILSARMRPSKS